MPLAYSFSGAKVGHGSQHFLCLIYCWKAKRCKPVLTAPRACIMCHTRNFSRHVDVAQDVRGLLFDAVCVFREGHSISSMFHRTLLDPQFSSPFSTTFSTFVHLSLVVILVDESIQCAPAREGYALADWLGGLFSQDDWQIISVCKEGRRNLRRVLHDIGMTGEDHMDTNYR